jgi:hypothetical protein
MISIQNDTLSRLLLILAVAFGVVVLSAVLGSLRGSASSGAAGADRVVGARRGAGAGSWSGAGWGSAVGVWVGAAGAVWAAGDALNALRALAAAGSFRFVDVGGWVGARLTDDLAPFFGSSDFGLSLTPPTALLLVCVTAVVAVAAVSLAMVHAQAHLAATLAIELAVVVALVADAPVHVAAAACVASALAVLAPLVASPSLVEGRAVLRAFMLHRVGDAALLGALLAWAASFGPSAWTSWALVMEQAATFSAWERLQQGVFAGFPHRTVWFFSGAGLSVFVATRLGILTWPMSRDLTASPRVLAPLAGVIHGIGLQGVAIVVLVRFHPLIALAPEAAEGLFSAAALSLVATGILGLATRDLLRADAFLLASLGSLVALLAAAMDLTGVVFGGLLALTAAVCLPWTSALVVAATKERDPALLGGLEKSLPRAHSARLLVTAALALPPLGGWILVERCLEGALLSVRVSAAVVVAIVLGSLLWSLASWRLVHRVFNGRPVELVGSDRFSAPPAAFSYGVLLPALVAPGLLLLALPARLLRLLPVEVTYQPPLEAFCAPAWRVSEPLRALYASAQKAPALAPSTFLVLCLLGGVLPWVASWFLFRGAARGRPAPAATLLSWAPLAWLSTRLASWAGREAGVARSVQESVEALSRLLAVNFIPTMLDLVLQRLPAACASVGAFVFRGTQTGVAPHAVVLALAVAAWLAAQSLLAGGTP